MKIITIIIIILVIITLIIGVVYFYYKHEKPLQENKIITRDINIKIVNFLTNKNIIANYTIGLGSKDNKYRNGTTLEHNYIQEKLPENNTFYISSNILDERFYNDYKIVNTVESGPFRIDLNLIPRGNLTIKHEGKFISDLNFNLTITKNGELRDLTICYLYSTKIIALYQNASLIEVNKLDEYKKYYKCFNLPDFNSTYSINYNYLNFGIMDKYDYIDFLIYDKDASNNIRKEFYYNVTI